MSGPASSPRTELIVQGDDFGMCHAVNTGTVRAFTDGVLTQASTMVACPWFPEAADLAKEHGIPLGIHATLTCEWDGLRWPPLTAGASLRGDDGLTFHRTVAGAMGADADEATAELEAQTDRFLAAGLDLTYYDVHMGMSQVSAYAAVTSAHGAPFLYPGVPGASLPFASIKMLSERPAATKKDWLLGYLERLADRPGVHLLVTHCADDEAELAALVRPDSPVHPWAREYRVSDLAVLTDPDVGAAVAAAGIELVSVSTAAF
ncbi:MAG TPA: ChbG/HpnK family deacetylase [Acidimicrobiales bacterium]|nr:ChbG/HpnK family deacetylase [Acidimicrobiales bacterium]